MFNFTSSKFILVTTTLILAGAAAFAFTLLFDFTAPTNPLPPPYELPTPTPTPNTILFFGGDIMLDREVKARMKSAQDANLPYTNILQAIKQADLSFANLESPFTNIKPTTSRDLIFHNDDDAVTGLAHAGFDVLSTANNHAFDQGPEGVKYTLEWLEAHGITPVGTGNNCHDGIVKEVSGVKFGFLAYSYAAYNDGGNAADPLVCNWKDTNRITSDIALLKPQVDFLIVSAHLGTEYQKQPGPVDVTRAHEAINAGADIIVGHHPHWIQTIEEYQGKYIFYSLGNLVFDQMWSQETREGLTLDLLFKGKSLDTIRLLPVIIENYCCPRWATDTETKNILHKINPMVETNILTLNGLTQPDWAQALKPRRLTNQPNSLKND
jgi:poly-gamma-glutamate synthesis protein (capsule biosynthesis protein)